MKTLLTIFVLFFSSSVLAENFVYHCNFHTYFKNSNDEEWKNKYIKYTFASNNNETISIYDHEIKITYFFTLEILTKNSQLIAMYTDSSALKTLVIDRENSFGTYAIFYTDGSDSGQYGLGKCNLQ